MPSIVFKNQVSFGQPSTIRRAENRKYGSKNNIDDNMTLPNDRNFVSHFKASKSEIQPHFHKKTSLQQKKKTLNFKAQSPLGSNQDSRRGTG